MKTITDIKGTFTLNNGIEMPYFGLGVYLSKDGQEVVNAVKWALDCGYRHIDTASIYKNETGVGKGIKESNVLREEVFVVSKVWNSDQGYETTLRAFEATLDRLGLEYLDLYLIHWPVSGKYKDTWRALEYLYEQKLVRSIGVSNFMEHHLVDLMEESSIVPMVNQMEFHPFLAQQSLLDFCVKNQIQYEAWSPMMQGNIFTIEEFKELAKKYKKSIAQIVLRWDLQKGVITIPKSSKKERIISNADIFDFELDQEDVDKLDSLDKSKRFGPDPDNFDF
ncbi:MAG: aldo/keto reductase [Eudoraea sp.]|uniref:aldo/keto reductase n=1 Tax=Eudoraea sp. TaxID=1979955 RepID=UPI003C70FAB8